MAELIAVTDGFNALEPSFLKRTALLFNRIAIPPATSDAIAAWNQYHPQECQELLWLIEQGIVFEAEAPTSPSALDEQSTDCGKLAAESMEKSLGVVLGRCVTFEEPVEAVMEQIQQKLRQPDSLDRTARLKFVGHYLIASSHLVRMFAALLRKKGLNACPILPLTIQAESSKASASVLEVVFDAFPIPSVDAPWEQILEYRADPDSYAKFLALRNWMNDMAQANFNPEELAEKLEYLLSKYERHLNLHELKTKVGTLETIVITATEIAENIATFHWSKVAKMPFSAKHKQIALLEAELASPGREVAYVYQTKRVFTSRPD